MALSYSSLGGGGIKSVQRGLASGSGNVTITAVNTSKAFVHCFGTTSSGTVAASGSINAATGNNASGTINHGRMIGKTTTWGGGNVSGPTSLGYYSNYTGGDTQTNNSISIYNNSLVTMAFQGHTSDLPSTAVTMNSTSLTGGSNNLVSAVVQAYLSDSTTLVVSGACRWEVVEFN